MRDLEETLIDWLWRSWRFLSVDLVPSILAWIMWLSCWFLDQVERVLYTVDEWLLFRTGESKLSLAAKAVLGVFWFAVTYVVLIYTNLLVEPTVNPIKHFPVVTVGHKLMLPILGTVFFMLEAPWKPLEPMSVARPGIRGDDAVFRAGHLRVYRLGTASELAAVSREPASDVAAGAGRQSRRDYSALLAAPGFHSGTVPKLFRKLRRAARHVQVVGIRKRGGSAASCGRELRHFIDREFLNLLLQSKGWAARRWR